jgi:tetratricopeptide (TPR) repeat protein
MSTRPTPRPDATTRQLERVYVLGIVSALALLALLIVLTVFTAGQLQKLAAADREQQLALESVARRLRDLESMPERAAAGNSRERTTVPATRLTPARQIVASTQAATAPVASSRADEPPASQPASLPVSQPAPRTEAQVAELFARLAEIRRTRPLSDEESVEAASLVRSASTARPGEFSPRMWALLAGLARAAEMGGIAEEMAIRATQGGAVPEEYLALSARVALRRGLINEASVFARRLRDAEPVSLSGRLVAGEVFAARGDLISLDALLPKDVAPVGLPIQDALALARLLAVAERWKEFDAVLAAIERPEGEWVAPTNRLRALQLVRGGRFAEALAIVEHLLEASPEDFDLNVLRGRALLESGQPGAAREALRRVESAAGRPEGLYWAGQAERAAQKFDEARRLLERALSIAPRYGPAWEALGELALEQSIRGSALKDAESAESELASAEQALSRAVECSPRRPTAHFSLALVHARAERDEACARSLQAAFKLDASLLARAKASTLITRRLAAEDLEALVPPPR